MNLQQTIKTAGTLRKFFHIKIKRAVWTMLDQNAVKIYQMISNNIYQFRILAHLSQAKLAEMSNVSAAYISLLLPDLNKP